MDSASGSFEGRLSKFNGFERNALEVGIDEEVRICAQNWALELLSKECDRIIGFKLSLEVKDLLLSQDFTEDDLESCKLLCFILLSTSICL
jgi:hypothetical protein